LSSVESKSSGRFGKRLADRGYLVAGERNVKGISNHASLHEIAAIYQKLGEKYS
jgi:hypothetical protein